MIDVDQVSVTHPHLSQALLASGSQMHQQQQYHQQQSQQVQVVAKEENRIGATSSSIIKSLLATKVTVSGDCMPSAAATCVSTPTACVTNTTASIASSISANQLITNNQVLLSYDNTKTIFLVYSFHDYSYGSLDTLQEFIVLIIMDLRIAEPANFRKTIIKTLCFLCMCVSARVCAH